jgi:chemotaxis signal transduction protein
VDIAPQWLGAPLSAGEEASRRRRTASPAFAVERQPHLVVLVPGGPLALPMDAIERIVRSEHLTALPERSGALRGVMTLPGEVVAVLDPAALFERSVLPLAAESCVVVLRRDTHAEGPAAGLLVDGVREVLDVAGFEIAAPPRAGGLFAARWIAGMTRVGGLVPILDLGALLRSPVARAALTAASEWLAQAALAAASEWLAQAGDDDDPRSGSR